VGERGERWRACKRGYTSLPLNLPHTSLPYTLARDLQR
jgi:hypothetical protein